MKMYVAGKWEEKPRVREVMALLTEAGHTITYDWTRNERPSLEQAILDLRGVQDADVLVGLFEKDLAYAGAVGEVVAALALGKPVYIMGDAPVISRCVFFKHPNIKRGENAFVRDLLHEGPGR